VSERARESTEKEKNDALRERERERELEECVFVCGGEREREVVGCANSRSWRASRKKRKYREEQIYIYI
jgi:hypothetical protein